MDQWFLWQVLLIHTVAGVNGKNYAVVAARNKQDALDSLRIPHPGIPEPDMFGSAIVNLLLYISRSLAYLVSRLLTRERRPSLSKSFDFKTVATVMHSRPIASEVLKTLPSQWPGPATTWPGTVTRSQLIALGTTVRLLPETGAVIEFGQPAALFSVGIAPTRGIPAGADASVYERNPPQWFIYRVQVSGWQPTEMKSEIYYTGHRTVAAHWPTDLDAIKFARIYLGGDYCDVGYDHVVEAWPVPDAIATKYAHTWPGVVDHDVVFEIEDAKVNERTNRLGTSDH